MKRVCEGTSHLTDNMKAEIRQVNILVIRYDTSLLLTECEGRTREYWRDVVSGTKKREWRQMFLSLARAS